jgi:glutamine synthetase
MKHYTKQDIMQKVLEDDVEFIRLQFTDMFGNLKNVAITTSQLDRALNNECMFDGSSIEGFVRIEESDMYLHPNFDSYVTFPWRPQQGKVARLICDVCTAEGKPFEGDPRFVLKKVIQEARDMGYTFYVGPELEFFLFHVEENGTPTTITHERGGYFDVAPVDLGENARRDMVLTLEDMGVEVEASHHEVAPAQHEIDIKYCEALDAADNIMTIKLVARTIAQRHGVHSTFMPKPKYGIDGSGMHVNMSLEKNGKNIFYDKNDKYGMSKEAYYFIAGIMKYIDSITAIANPLVNSYKRLVPNYEAPIYIAWSAHNRSPLIRIPTSKPGNTRLELRSPDPSANPYLTLAVCLAAGLEGIKNQQMPPEGVDKNLFAMTEQEREAMGIGCLPQDLNEAIHSLENCDFIQNVLGEHLCRKYIEAKKEEWDSYRLQVSQWELDQYLYRI